MPKWLANGLVGLGIVAALSAWIFLGSGVYRLFTSVSSVIHAQHDYVAGEDLEGAYGLSVPGSYGGAEGLRAYLQAYEVWGDGGRYRFTSTHIENGEATLGGRYHFDDGGNIAVSVTLRRINGAWKVKALMFAGAPRASGAPEVET